MTAPSERIAKRFEEVAKYQRQTALLQGAQALLEWDERTGMPIRGGDWRADQVALLAGMIHRRQVDTWLEEALVELADTPLALDPNSDHGATIHGLLKDVRRAKKLPTTLVEEISRATVTGQQAWEEARRDRDFARFQPALSRMLELKRQAAQCLAIADRPLYDALLDEYEEGAESEKLTVTFAELRKSLVALATKVHATASPPSLKPLRRFASKESQQRLSTLAAKRIGFDFDRGRLDETSHPFCTSLGPNDCRILTRYQENWWPAAFYGTLHEAGHGLYDQGLRGDWYGLPPGSFVSLGIHESQSRLWENIVGRSLPFWNHFWPEAQAVLGSAFNDVSAETIWRGVNVSQPSLIRVEADELTYNLHIILRFELEQQLLCDAIPLEALPEVWADRYEQDLGIRPAHVGEGVLQDVHWSAGLFGYFPTYTLGNLIAAQLMEAAQRELGNLDDAFRSGGFASLLNWLRKHIHAPGRCYNAAALVQRATGEAIHSDALIRYLTAKYTTVYQL